MRTIWSTRFHGLLAAAALLCATAEHARAQIPVGPQFQVNTYTPFLKQSPDVAAGASGAFVVVWDSGGSAGSDDSGYSVQGQRYDAAGSAVAGEFQINAHTTSHQFQPRVAADPSGNFVVVWASYGGLGSDESGISVQGQRYDGAGLPVGAQFQVNTYTTSGQAEAAVAADGGGNFVVVWQSAQGDGSDTDKTSVHGQRYDATGSPLGGEFQVNSYTTSYQGTPDVAADASGNFVVVWDSSGSAGSDADGSSIHGQRYNSAGVPVGAEFQVNTYTTGQQFFPAVAIDGAGSSVVVWSSDGSAGSDTSPNSVQGRRYDASGTPLGSQFQVNSYTTGSQSSPVVSADAVGNVVVSWSSLFGSGSDQGTHSVQAQSYDPTGAPIGGQFQVNTYTTGGQYNQAVTATTPGAFAIVWRSEFGDGTDPNQTIQGQRFSIGTSTTSTSTTSTTSTTTTSTVAALLILGKKFQIRDPSGAEANRKVLALAKETSTDVGTGIVGDPTATGATLRVIANGMNGSQQSYVLDASGWSPAGSIGFKYSGPTGVDGDPVKKVLLKRTPGGTAFLKALIKGNTGTQSLDVVPPTAGTDGGVVLEIHGGGVYCAAFGGPAGGTETHDTAQTWQVVVATAQPGCPVSTVSTTTTLPSCAVAGSPCGSCGTGVCVAHCDPDPPTLFCTGSATPGGCTDDTQCGSGEACGGQVGQCGHPTFSGCGVPCP
jgi:hypothetical protein